MVITALPKYKIYDKNLHIHFSCLLLFINQHYLFLLENYVLFLNYIIRLHCK